MRRIAFLVFTFVLNLPLSPPLFSETPPPGSKIGPEEEAFRRPRREMEPEKKPVIESEALQELPPGAGIETSFFVREILIEGKTNLKPGEAEAALAPYRNQTLTLSGLQEA